MLKTSNAPIPKVIGMVSIFYGFTKTAIPMHEQFIEMTDEIFWKGYAEQLAQDNPARFQFELSEFMNTCQF
jgi:hypothetical protein